ncbi:ArsR/SmtB family transcription factor [Roseivivax jejudonensis]|uniref:ArsR/SmtB family transcription factor n=1 Tax=Roseivivax jejudonensis TaxID=1529041 RepID=UPI001F206FFC|nr:metalloregulator ArsR/SmtB family transcription factor [Roseivivax jejudonensis]
MLEQLENRADHVAGLLSLMGNSRRLLILCRLAEGEASVGALQAQIGLGQSALSQHLAKLRAAGVVATRRDGQSVFYRIADDDVRAIMASLYDTFCREARGDG